MIEAKQAFGFRYNSDCRGQRLFRPTLADGSPGTPQIPVDLPTFDEVVGSAVAAKDFNAFILERFTPQTLNVYTIHAEVEGILMANDFRQLLAEARRQDIHFQPLGNLLPEAPATLPMGHVARGTLEGREGWLGGYKAHEPALDTAVFLLVVLALAYLLPLGTHGLWIPDETRYAQISQDMLLSGNWVSPHFMSLRYFEKPVAGYWMIAIGQALFGDNLFGVRIASALSTGLSVWLCYLIARRLWNEPRKSFACALLYMSFTIVAGQAGYANLDPQFTFWVNLSLVALWFALDSVNRGPRLLGWAMLGLACGMGFMTKGFLAWLLPVLIALPWMLWQKNAGASC